MTDTYVPEHIRAKHSRIRRLIPILCDAERRERYPSGRPRSKRTLATTVADALEATA